MPGSTTATIKRLFAVSGNRCAFPGCEAPLVIGDTVTGEVCHIETQSADGPRYDPDQGNAERHGFDNLVLMCGDHHTVIDADSDTYTVEKLLEIKTQGRSRLLPLAASAHWCARSLIRMPRHPPGLWQAGHCEPLWPRRPEPMQQAKVGSHLITAGPRSPKTAQCPACGATVRRRKRRVHNGRPTYFYRHEPGNGEGCPLRYWPGE